VLRDYWQPFGETRFRRRPAHGAEQATSNTGDPDQVHEGRPESPRSLTGLGGHQPLWYRRRPWRQPA
jgi:hypothetical protein